MRSTSELPRLSRFETARAKGNRLYAQLYADILNGRLRPGEPLSETRIADRHGISRTPVRSAARRAANRHIRGADKPYLCQQ
jgi:DNA-binding GntR family transcriptional regulator